MSERESTREKPNLTPEQEKILGSIARGECQRSIREKLGASKKSMQNKVREIYNILGARTDLEAVVIAIKQNILNLDWALEGVDVWRVGTLAEVGLDYLSLMAMNPHLTITGIAMSQDIAETVFRKTLSTKVYNHLRLPDKLNKYILAPLAFIAYQQRQEGVF